MRNNVNSQQLLNTLRNEIKTGSYGIRRKYISITLVKAQPSYSIHFINVRLLKSCFYVRATIRFDVLILISGLNQTLVKSWP